MQKMNWLRLLLLLFAALCSHSTEYKHSLIVEPQRLTDALAQENGIFVDLRTEKEYNRMHIPGFINMPYDEETVLTLAGEKDAIYLICTSGRTSAKAYNLLLDAGAPEVHAAIFGVEEYAEAMGLETMEGADICVPCIQLQRLMDEGMQEVEKTQKDQETSEEATEVVSEEYGEEET